jgi:gamma-glutamyltranspeptidase/glutathione hydrolase
MPIDLGHHPYPGRRLPLIATNGAVATSHPLAAQAGLQMLQLGGSAVDAAIATAAALTVLEPTSNGLGSDGFALIWADGKLHGLNGSGRAPALLSLEALAERGLNEVPLFGWLSVTVPGAIRMWADLHARFGKLDFARLLQPAIEYAEHGAAVTPTVAVNWANRVQHYRTVADAQFAGFLRTFDADHHGPQPGQRVRLPGHARTLKLLAAHGAEVFYQGEIAAALDRYARETGGLLRAEDLAAHRSEWVEPISIDYRGYTVHEIPPNGQGIAALMALGTLENGNLAQWPRESAASYHLQIEAIKQAFADAFTHVGDPAMAAVPTARMLDRARLAERFAAIGPRAATYPAMQMPQGGTVYLATADRDGQMVSLIQSNFHGFGSGVVHADYGISLQNRGYGFVTTPGHVNQLAPGKRPFHTIIPGFLTRNGKAVGPFGVMGGHMQPQGHAQVVISTVDYGLHPQAALDAPRWRAERDGSLMVEQSVPRDVIEGLIARGHRIVIEPESGGFGRGQIIWQLDNGSLVAGSDGRCDGMAVGW